MKTATNILELVEVLKVKEGPDFSCQEELLAQHLEKEQEPKPALSTSVLGILGGSLATLAFVGFLIVAGLYNSTGGLIFFGLLASAGGLALHHYSKSLSYDSIAITLYLCGFAMLLAGLNSADVDDNGIALLMFLLGIISYSITESTLIGFSSALIASGSVLTLLTVNHTPDMLHVYNLLVVLSFYWVCTNEGFFLSKTFKTAHKYQALRAALLLSVITGLAPLGEESYGGLTGNYTWFSTVANTALILVCSHFIMGQLSIQSLLNKIIIYTLSILLLALCAYSPGISGALLIILLSFRTNYKWGLATGILAFVYFITRFYYDLNLSLLQKSGLLFGSGILFLALYFILLKGTTHEQE